MKGVTKLQILLMLTVAWVALIVWVLGDAPSDSVPLKYVSGQRIGQTGGKGERAMNKIMGIEQLEKRKRHAEKPVVAKNIFASVRRETGTLAAQASASGDPPVRTSRRLAAREMTQAKEDSQPSAEDNAREFGRQEIAAFRYVGYLHRDGKEEAVLSRGAELHIVKPGDMIDGKVRVKAIAPLRIILMENAGEVEQALPLEGESL
ncbi:hypothetical protein [Nitrospira sp. Nam80]